MNIFGPGASQPGQEFRSSFARRIQQNQVECFTQAPKFGTIIQINRFEGDIFNAIQPGILARLVT